MPCFVYITKTIYPVEPPVNWAPQVLWPGLFVFDYRCTITSPPPSTNTMMIEEENGAPLILILLLYLLTTISLVKAQLEWELKSYKNELWLATSATAKWAWNVLYFLPLLWVPTRILNIKAKQLASVAWSNLQEKVPNRIVCFKGTCNCLTWFGSEDLDLVKQPNLQAATHRSRLN